MLENNWKVKIENEVEYQSKRSRGPGGQHVNRTESAVQLRWDFRNSLVFNEDERFRIFQKLKNRINSEGVFYLTVESERSLFENKRKAFQLFLQFLSESLIIPKTRIKTKPKRSSVEKRLNTKDRRGEIKKLRKKLFN